MKITLQDVARMAGVSKATASRVINGLPGGASAETRERIEAIVKETGYQPSGFARGLATGRSWTIGLIIPDITNPFHPAVVRGVEDVLNRAGYSLFLCNSDGALDKELAYVRVLIERGVDGVIINSAASDCDCQLDLLEKASIPYVVLDRIIDRRRPYHAVFLDNREGASLAVGHLLKRPDCRLLYLDGPTGHSQSRLRRRGMEDALKRASLENSTAQVLEGDYSLESGRRLVAEALGDWTEGRNLPFNAVFACNDLMAVGAMQELQRRGLSIPRDVRVMGFDDIELASLVEPALSTVAQPTFEMGARSAEMLLKLTEGKIPRPRQLMLKPKLVLRGSA